MDRRKQRKKLINRIFRGKRNFPKLDEMSAHAVLGGDVISIERDNFL